MSEFRFWDEAQPSDFVGEEKCVEMNMMLGKSEFFLFYTLGNRETKATK